MALAYLSYEESDGENRRFSIDLGRNSYYGYAIGEGESINRHGIHLLRDPTYESEVLGPLDEDEIGRGELLVPENRFSRKSRFIQLQSYRTGDGVGPAVSEIVETDPGERDEDEAERYGRSFAMTQAPVALQRSIPRPRRRRAHVRETKQLSTAQFIDALVSMLPQLLPMAGGLIGAITGQGRAGGTGSTPAAAPPWLGQLTQFIQQLLAQSGTAGARPAVPPAQPTAPPAQAASLAMAQANYSQAMVLPLLAMLPALMPLLQQVLSPQTIQGVLQTADPNRLIGTVSNAINGFAQLGMQSAEAERAHLRALNPGVDDPALMALLSQMSTNLKRAARQGPKYKRTDKARLHFADSSNVQIGGRQVVAYVHGRDLQFPLALETPKALPPGALYVCIQHAETLDHIARFRVKTPPLSEGRMSVIPEFKAEEVSLLEPGQDYLVKAELVWKNKAGQRIGTTTTQTVRIIGEYTFDSVQEGEEIVPLNDVDRYRDFWHKVWQDSFSKEVARREYECKYYYVFGPELTENEQAKTRLSEEDKGIRKVVGRMSAGLLLSPNRLNELLPQIGSGPSLGEAELKALLDPRFVDRMSLAARYHAKFGGPPERPAALWVFPEVKVQRILLRQADNVDQSGHVVSLADKDVRFPMPVMAHFVGVTSE
jgi:hypothetical protein